MTDRERLIRLVQEASQSKSDYASFYEQKAMEANMDVNEYRKLQQMKRENEQLRRQNEDYIRQQQMEQKYRTWIQQGQQTKEIYPNFDINAESQNPVECARANELEAKLEKYEKEKQEETEHDNT